MNMRHTDLSTNDPDTSWANLPPTDIDAAYAVKVFLDHHPGKARSISILARLCGLSEQRLQASFSSVFNESLEQYWKRVQ